MLKKLLIASVLFGLLFVSCSGKKNELLGGLEKLKWHSDVSDMKNYMENDVKARYENYKVNRDEKTLSMFFNGGKYAGEEVSGWELKSKEGKFFEFTAKFPSDDELYERIKKVLTNKLGEPTISEKRKTVWKKESEEGNVKEKITLRKFADAVTLVAEAEEK